MRPSRYPILASFLSPVAAAFLTGCGGVHGIPIDQTATNIAQAVCSSAWRCCTVAELMGNDAAGTSAADCSTNTAPCEQACESKTAENFRGELSGVQQSVDQKRAVYEQAKVDACLNTIRSSSCDALNVTGHLTGVPGCESFVTPLVAIGGACGNDYECIDGWCMPPASGSGDGVCAPGATGQSCAAGNCASGLTCDPGSSADTSDDVCVAPADNGATCSDDFQCKSGNCSSSGGSGMTCAASTSAMCFYASGCSAAGGRPGPATLLLLAGFIAIALVRARRRRNP